MKKFSILLNSRKRPHLLRKLLESIENTAADIEELSVFIGFDDDDELSRQYEPELLNEFNFIQTFWRKREQNLHTYLNLMAKETNSDYYFILNDDCILTRSGFDFSAYAKLEDFVSQFPDRIVYGKTFDNSIDKLSTDYAAFPIISKEAYKALGYVLSPEISYWGADLLLAKCFIPLERVCDLRKEVTIKHLMHDGTLETDGLRDDMLKYYKSQDKELKDIVSDIYNFDLSKDIGRLRDKINGAYV